MLVNIHFSKIKWEFGNLNDISSQMIGMALRTVSGYAMILNFKKVNRVIVNILLQLFHKILGEKVFRPYVKVFISI